MSNKWLAALVVLPCLAVGGMTTFLGEVEVSCDGCIAETSTLVVTPIMPARVFPPPTETDGGCFCLMDEDTGEVILPCRELQGCVAEQTFTELVGPGGETCVLKNRPGPPGPANPAICYGAGGAAAEKVRHTRCDGEQSFTEYWQHPPPAGPGAPMFGGPWFHQLTLFAGCSKCDVSCVGDPGGSSVD